MSTVVLIKAEDYAPQTMARPLLNWMLPWTRWVLGLCRCRPDQA